MHALLARLGVDKPVLAAPMAGGPTTPTLVVAAARAGSLGFLAGGYKSPDALAEDMAAVRSEGVVFGVNLFAPNLLPVDPQAFLRYADRIQSEADRYGLSLATATPIEDDDGWSDKLDVLLADPVAAVSFTFGIPSREVVRSLQRAGMVVAQTVTSLAEGHQAAAVGVDLLVAQGVEAGGHSGTLTPKEPLGRLSLVELVTQLTGEIPLPVAAAGGLATSTAIAGVLASGAMAAVVGTVLLLTEESGASTAHKGAIATAPAEWTAITRAFTGRPARGLRNRFLDRYSDEAPFGYPALHHLTSPLRRAATAAGDPEVVNLWAGTGYHHAVAEPLARSLDRLAERV